ncbi:MAG TPA: zinc ribbon domain-containing protein [Thermoplasmata archaeon]|nr:zinc ribbon domain-containing protein [Thermoplasmata archaeon]
MAISGLAVELLLVVAVLTVGLLLFMVYFIRRAKERGRTLSGEIALARGQTEDRAHNQIRLARAEATILKRDGADVAGPERLLGEADAAIARQDFHHALQLSKTAHDALVAMRQRSSGSAVPAAERLPGSFGPRGLVDLTALPTTDGPASSEGPGAGAPPAMPKNRLESHFQLELLSEELARAASEGRSDPALAESNRLAAEAKASEGRGDFTEALRIALKARRTLGGSIESLPLTRSVAPAPPSRTPSAGAAPPARCARCGEALRASDAFCRACGAPRAAGSCPRCSAPLEPADRFCATCGSPVDAASA